MDPNVTDQQCPMAGTATATTGENPKPTRRGAATAMGTPYPATPWRKEENTHPKISSWMVLSPLKRWIPAPMASMAPVSLTTL